MKLSQPSPCSFGDLKLRVALDQTDRDYNLTEVWHKRMAAFFGVFGVRPFTMKFTRSGKNPYEHATLAGWPGIVRLEYTLAGPSHDAYEQHGP